MRRRERNEGRCVRERERGTEDKAQKAYGEKIFLFKNRKTNKCICFFFQFFFFLKNLRVLTRSKVRFLLILKFYLYNIKIFF